MLQLIKSPQLRSLDIRGIDVFPVKVIIQLYSSSNLQCLIVKNFGFSVNHIDEHAFNNLEGIRVQQDKTSPLTRSTVTEIPPPKLSTLFIDTEATQPLKLLLGIPISSCQNPPKIDFQLIRQLTAPWNSSEFESDSQIIESCSSVEDLECLCTCFKFATVLTQLNV